MFGDINYIPYICSITILINFLIVIIMEVKIKRLCDNAIIPQYAHATDAGMDLVATSYEYNEKLHCHVYGTGIAVEIPEGYVGYIFPRSSNRKTESYLTNHVGVIDSGYRGEIMASFKTRDFKEGEIQQLYKPYEVGDKIAQLIIMPYPKVEFAEVAELSSSDRGEGGHGSTGSKIDILKEIEDTKRLRKDIYEVIDRVKSLNQCRETSLVITKLQEGDMWLGMNLMRLDVNNPHCQSHDSENTEAGHTDVARKS